MKKQKQKGCRDRKLRKDEEMAWPDWEEARKMENGEWRPEPEGEAEVLDIIFVSDAVDGTFADLAQAFGRNSRISTTESGSGQEELTGLK